MNYPDRRPGKKLVTDHPGIRFPRDPKAIEFEEALKAGGNLDRPEPMETDPSRFTNMDDELQKLLIEERTKELIELGDHTPEEAREQAEYEQR